MKGQRPDGHHNGFHSKKYFTIRKITHRLGFQDCFSKILGWLEKQALNFLQYGRTRNCQQPEHPEWRGCDCQLWPQVLRLHHGGTTSGDHLHGGNSGKRSGPGGAGPWQDQLSHLDVSASSGHLRSPASQCGICSTGKWFAYMCALIAQNLSSKTIDKRQPAVQQRMKILGVGNSPSYWRVSKSTQKETKKT